MQESRSTLRSTQGAPMRRRSDGAVRHSASRHGNAMRRREKEDLECRGVLLIRAQTRRVRGSTIV